MCSSVPRQESASSIDVTASRDLREERRRTFADAVKQSANQELAATLAAGVRRFCLIDDKTLSLPQNIREKIASASLQKRSLMTQRRPQSRHLIALRVDPQLGLRALRQATQKKSADGLHPIPNTCKDP